LTDLVTNTPPIEQQSLALDAAIRSSNGRDGANKVEVVNTDEIKSDDLDLSIADSAKGVAEQGVRQLITSGEVNTRNLAGSFATSLLSKATDNAVDAVMDFDWMKLLFANGGIAKGGFRAFAKGGVVNRPTLGLVGEGKYNEAVVPLPDGKSIPVIGGGGETNNNITVNVTIDSDGNAKSDAQQPGIGPEQAKQLGYMVTQAVQSELVEQKRPGGLLSSY
jgi:phage-related minor tail protein